MWQRIKNFYITIFGYVLKWLKAAINWNKGLIQGIKADFIAEKYIIVGLKILGYGLLCILQIVAFIAIIISYIACKLTGVCLII